MSKAVNAASSKDTVRYEHAVAWDNEVSSTITLEQCGQCRRHLHVQKFRNFMKFNGRGSMKAALVHALGRRSARMCCRQYLMTQMITERLTRVDTQQFHEIQTMPY